MIQISRNRAIILSGLFCFAMLSCAKDSSGPAVPGQRFPVTSAVNITFDKRSIPDQCIVFSHVMVAVPAGMIETDIRRQVENFAMENGADYIFVGKARESDKGVDEVTFSSYGPRTPYSFKSGWAGWKFGFRDWSRNGPLVDYGQNHLTHAEPAFDREITTQAILLRCQDAQTR